MKREQILLGVVLLLVALLGYGLFGQSQGTHRVRAASQPLELAELPALDPVVDLAASTAPRDPFRARRDTEPLPPLELPLPEAPELPVLLPPPLPDAGPSRWSEHLMVVPARLPGTIDEVVAEDADSSAEALPGADDAAPSRPPAAGQAPLDYAAAYDSVKLNPFTVRYGHIVDANRYDKKPGEAITLEEIDPRTGKVMSAARTFQPGEYESFRFADTLRNRIELDVRALPVNAGTVPRVREMVGWLLQQGDAEPAAFVHAETLARRGVELAGDDLESWMTLGSVWERTFRFDQAFALYAQLAGETLPGTAPNLGLSVPSGRYARAAAPRVRMALILRRLGLDQQAEGPLRDAVALNDGSAVAPLELGLLLLETGRPSEAVPLLERVRSMADRSSSAAQRGLDALGRAQLELGAYTAAGEAFADAARAAAAGTGNLEAQRAARAGMVSAAYLAGDFAKAMQLASAAVDELGPDARLLYLRGICNAAGGGPAGEVVRDLRAAAAAAPLDAAPALCALAFWLDVQGMSEQAGDSLGRALEQTPGYGYGLYLRALFARRAGDHNAAREDLRSLVRMDPNCAAALGELGSILYDEGLYQAAEVVLRRAEQLAPQQSGIALRRGFNLLRNGDIDGGRAALARAIAADPALYAARNAMGWAAYAENDLNGAVAEFGEIQDMLRDQPEHPQAAFAKLWQVRIQAHAQLQRWHDSFDSSVLQQQWDAQTIARMGVEPKVEGGALHLRGTHSGEGTTRIYRSVRALDFRSFGGDLTAGPEQRGNAGMLIALETKGAQRRTIWAFKLYRDREGALRWLMEGASGEPQSGTLNRRIPAGETFHVEFALDREPRPPVLTVTVDGAEAFHAPVSALISPGGDMSVGAYVETSNAVAVDLSVDNVELIYALPK